MGTMWTEEQQQVIDLRNRNILVSAAAGSGKTAVLVERILSKISDPKHPVDIDRLLVVTFTNAAAAEMKERVALALENRLKEHPRNAHLHKQVRLIPMAQITTLHKFCKYVIGNYFNTIDLDPSFRIGEDMELSLMKTDVAEELIEVYYKSKNTAFLDFVDKYARGKTDKGLEELIIKVYEFSMSHTWPKQWLNDCKEAYNVTTLEDLEQHPMVLMVKAEIKKILPRLHQIADEAMELCQTDQGPKGYGPAVAEDLKLITDLEAQETFAGCYELLHQVSFARLGRESRKGVSPKAKEQVKNIRKEIKDEISGVATYFERSPEELLADMEELRPSACLLMELVQMFSEKYQEKKADKNLVDFNDLEHFTLAILRNEDGSPTEAADALAHHYDEILSDEYQDSNGVQEAIINCISSERFGRPNVFTVGDVKQSIYRFRMADPEIFMSKYNTYTQTESLYQRIDLSKNFRSRDQVLESINLIFKQIMYKDLGDIDYDDKAALYPGATFEETQTNIGKTTEVILVSGDDALIENDEDLAKADSKTIEAKAVAAKIKEMTLGENPTYVWDKQLKDYRPAEYRDIAVLLRTISGWSDIFVTALAEEGIMAHAETSTGFFGTVEVQNMVSFLSVIDNPRQDIPLAAVLISPIAQLSSSELAEIRAADKEGALIDACEKAETTVEEPLKSKLSRFLEILENLRQQASYTSIYDLIHEIYKYTGYNEYLAAMPGGPQRLANLEMLEARASAYETTSYQGVFNFIRYIERLKKYNMDIGEAPSNLMDNSVTIVSIHKSKGLEYPIVIAAGMGKRFNQQDAISRVVLHPHMGIAMDRIDLNKRLKQSTLMKQMISRRLVLESLGEELRVLYVALTRAKEKLIMTGFVKDLDKSTAKWQEIASAANTHISYGDLTKASTYLDWVMPAIYKLGDQCTNFEIGYFTPARLVMNQIQENLASEALRYRIEAVVPGIVKDINLKKLLDLRMNWLYPHQVDTEMHAKMSVSQLKKLGTEEETWMHPSLPAEVFSGNEVQGADLGTATHKVMELLDYGRLEAIKDLEKQIETMVLDKKLTGAEAAALHIQELWQFATSDLGQRMKYACANQKLYREQPFVIGVEASQVMPEADSHETVLIQGIIDAYFEEDGKLILVDYKTDRVSPVDGAKVLKQRYHTQLEYYAEALKRMTGKVIGEKIIYAFTLNQSIIL